MSGWILLEISTINTLGTASHIIADGYIDRPWCFGRCDYSIKNNKLDTLTNI